LIITVSGVMIAAIALGVGAFTVLHTTTSHASPGFQTPRFYTFHHNLNAGQIGASAVALPTWSSSFAYNGTTYQYSMVGTNPTAGSKTGSW
jgi:hypothetical protein